METPFGDLELYHVGIAVQDIDDAMQRYERILGVKRWARLDSSFPSRYRGEPTLAEAKIAYGDAGTIWVELVQPTGGTWPATVALERRGEGVYHIGYWVEDVNDAVRRVEESGLEIDFALEGGGNTVVAFLDAAETAGVYVELVAGSLKPFIESRFQ